LKTEGPPLPCGPFPGLGLPRWSSPPFSSAVIPPVPNRPWPSLRIKVTPGRTQTAPPAARADTPLTPDPWQPTASTAPGGKHSALRPLPSTSAAVPHPAGPVPGTPRHRVVVPPQARRAAPPPPPSPPPLSASALTAQPAPRRFLLAARPLPGPFHGQESWKQACHGRGPMQG